MVAVDPALAVGVIAAVGAARQRAAGVRLALDGPVLRSGVGAAVPAVGRGPGLVAGAAGRQGQGQDQEQPGGEILASHDDPSVVSLLAAPEKTRGLAKKPCV